MKTNVNNKTKEDDLVMPEKFIMLMVSENGKYYWITSSNISEKQKDVLSRVHAVIEKPSYILLVILYIEIYLLSFFTYVKSIFK
jgi:hypothetical protein